MRNAAKITPNRKISRDMHFLRMSTCNSGEYLTLGCQIAVTFPTVTGA